MTIMIAMTAQARAQQASTLTYRFDIGVKPVTQGVNDIGRITGLSVVLRENNPVIVSGRAVVGQFTAEEAFSRLLEGTGLEFRFSNASTVQIIDPSGASSGGAVATEPGGTIALDVVTIEGENLGTTEGTGSYTANIATFGGIAQSIRQIPRSVSVVTNQQLQDQNLDTVNEALNETNGVTIVYNDDVNQRSEIYMRGFALDSYQIDGTSISANNDVNSFDTAIYDRVEVLRGPSGVLQGAREPGGTVNLVRKRPTDILQIQGSAEAGSWNHYRGEFDVSTPLVESGSVAGRFIGVVDSSDSFVDLVNAERQLLYGVLDFDLSESTTLSLGGTWQEGEGRDSRGLPAYADGTLLNVPRSTFAGQDWAYSRTRSSELFAELNHEFDNGAQWRASGIYLDRDRDGLLAYATAAVDLETGYTKLRPEHRLDRENNLSLDTSFTAPFDVGGLTQTVVAGASYQRAAEELDMGRASNIPFNIFDPDYDLPESDIVFDRWDRVESEQYGLYGQVQIKPIEWGTIVLGGRYAWWNTSSIDRESGEAVANAAIDGKFTPYIGAVIDVSENISVYASYTSIFVPQDEMTADNEILPAREGEQYEVGLKASLFDGRANATFSVFDIEDSNRAVEDPNDADFYVASGRVRSRGFEAEISGEIQRGWEISAGYTYLTTKYVDDGDLAGQVFEPRAPKHSAKVWTTYTFDQDTLEGVSIGGGVRAYSETYRLYEGVEFSQGGYAVVDAQLGYQVTENVKAALTVTNLFDKVYYASVGYSERQNYYGAPRAFAFKLNATF